MTDKQINTCEFLNICQTDCNGTLEDAEICHCYELYKQLAHKEQECERLKQALADIKEIAKSFCDECKEFGGELHQDRDCMYCNYGKILQLISEVEDES